MANPAALVAELESVRTAFGRGTGRRKLELMRRLAEERVHAAHLLWRLHESLLFLRAWPDSRAVLEAAEALLRSFAARVGRAPRAIEALDERGVAGTSIYSASSLPIVRWLLDRHPGAVTLYAGGEGLEERLGAAWPRLLAPIEVEAVEDGYLGAFAWLERTRAAAGAPDLARLLAIVDGAVADERTREALWTALDVAVRWDLGTGPGSRTLARAPDGPVVFQKRPLDRSRPDLVAATGVPDLVRVAAAEAPAWIDLARASIVARLRETHAFNYASPADLWIADAGAGVRLVVAGVEPKWRHALRTFYGYLIVKNGVPVGYGDALLVFDWGEINFHVFETFRQGESAQAYGAVVALFRRHFGLRHLFLNRYQFGHHNEDAIRSGAFWFYEKMGFRPEEADLVELWQTEREALARDPAHRSPARVLRRLASGHMALALGGASADWRGFHPLQVGIAVSRRIEERFGGDRRAAERAALARIPVLLGGAWSGAEGEALRALAPLLDALPGLDAWRPAERLALAAAVRAKAATRERGWLTKARVHARFRAAVVELASGARS